MMGQKVASLDSYKRVIDRRKWVARLILNTVTAPFNKKREAALLKWGRETRVSYSELLARIDDYVELPKNNRNASTAARSKKKKKERA